MDANMEFYWEMSVDNFEKYDANLYFIEITCSEETVLKRIKSRQKSFSNESDNLSRAKIEDYYIYLERKSKKEFPKERVFYTINSDTTLEEIYNQVNVLVNKIKKENK